MIPARRRNQGAAPTTFLIALLAGCARPPAAVAPTKPTEVQVAPPLVQDVNDYEDFTGRTEAVSTVDLHARVTGYLQEVHFKDGTDVKKGDLLFSIDPALYRAELDRARASRLLAGARLARLEKDFKRVEPLIGNGVSLGEVDLILGDRDEAKANLQVADAAVNIAQQNVDWTKVYAPIGGRISRRAIDAGNLVKADDTILTSIVDLETIDVYFDVDERTTLRLRRLVREGRVTSVRRQERSVRVGVADEEGFSLPGAINFVDNRVDAATGTLRVRAAVANPERNGSRLLAPGFFVRVRLPVGPPRPAVLVPEMAVGTDQGNKYLYVVDAADVVQYRAVRLGSVFDRHRVVEEGLNPGERVVVTGQQRVRPGAKVTAKPAPAMAPPADALAAFPEPGAPTP